jgi:hypothetical protein
VSSGPVCDICGLPLSGDDSTPWQRPDTRYPSLKIQKVTWVHRLCVPPTGDEPETTDNAA